jgi:hypothetical protein
MPSKLSIPINDWEGKWETTEYQDVFSSNTPMTEIQSNTLYITDAGYLAFIIRGVEGKILTLIESSTDDKEKRESLKSIARQLIWSAVCSETRLLKVKKIK